MDIDLSGPYASMVDRSLKQARQFVSDKAYDKAADAYQETANLMEQYAYQTLTEKVKQQRLEKANKYAQIARELRENPQEFIQPRRSSTPSSKTAEEQDENQFNAIINSFIDSSAVTWRDIGGLNEVVEQLKWIYGLGIAKAKGVKGRHICLYGPPGTGKTLLASACSHHMEATFFNVSADQLLSKYFGESEKIVSRLFQRAYELSPSLIFVDDFEALLLSREQGISGAEGRVLREFLNQMDGLKTKKSDELVIFIGATNMPWVLDKACIDRFSGGFIYVPLPDPESREQILRIHLKAEGYKIFCSYGELSKMTTGYSGRNLKFVAEAAIFRMLKRVNPRFTDVVDQGLEAIKKYHLEKDTISQDDILNALSEVKPTTDTATVQKYMDWGETRSVG